MVIYLYLFHYIQNILSESKKNNTLQVLKEHPPGQIIVLDHKISLNKPKKTESISRHLFQPPQKLITRRNKLQEENWKNCNYAEIKQHATKQRIGQRRNQKRNKKYFETNENGNKIYQNL